MPTARRPNHDIVPPLADANSRVLILGSMLSPKSVEAEFYYAHPQNRFWKVLSAVLGCPAPSSTEERRRLALSHGIALWDVIRQCDIIGAADSTIKNVVYNDIKGLLEKYPNITDVFSTGNKAYELLKKYNEDIRDSRISAAVRLPSPSPLNCAMSFEELCTAYNQIAIALRR